jgi:hypothetical protein
MMRKQISLALFVLLLTGCDVEYWWTRGQPPGVQTLYTRAESRLNEALNAPTANRPDIQSNVTTLRSSLGQAVKALNGFETEAAPSSALIEALEKAKNDF